MDEAATISFGQFLFAAIVFWVIFVLLPSLTPVRRVLATPLIARDPGGNADAAYLLAGGDAFRERLSAAVSCFHAGRVPLLILQRDDRPSALHHSGERWTATEWAVAYLEWRGVPRDRILVIAPGPRRGLGTASEARNVASNLPAGTQQLLLITSAAHTRRTLLVFRRRLPRGVKPIPRPATPYTVSLELHRPLWIEYVKLLVYVVFVLPAPYSS